MKENVVRGWPFVAALILVVVLVLAVRISVWQECIESHSFFYCLVSLG